MVGGTITHLLKSTKSPDQNTSEEEAKTLKGINQNSLKLTNEMSAQEVVWDYSSFGDVGGLHLCILHLCFDHSESNPDIVLDKKKKKVIFSAFCSNCFFFYLNEAYPHSSVD